MKTLSNLLFLGFVITGAVPAAADVDAPSFAGTSEVSALETHGVSRAPAGRRFKRRAYRRRAPRCQHAIRNCGKTTSIEQCMTCNAVREGLSEGMNGMISANRTVIARAKSGLYPNNICAVIYQPKQFSWTSNPRTCVSPKHWARAKASAAEALRRGSNGKLYYHADYVRPSWARKCIGRAQAAGEKHIFYEYCGTQTQVAKYRRVTQSRIAAAPVRSEMSPIDSTPVAR